MRKELLYQPSLFFTRLGEILTDRRRVRSLSGTVAKDLTHYHIDSLELLQLITSEGGAKIIFDVGANVGTWSRLARVCIPDAHIHAFEPLPDHLGELNDTARELGRMDVHQIACGASPGRLNLHVTAQSDSSSLLEPDNEGKKLYGLKTIRQEPVEVQRLDDFVTERNLTPPDLLKMDVQGAEMLVLRGSEQTLANTRWVLSEVSFRRFYKDQALFSDLAGWLAARGFEVVAFGHSLRKERRLDQVDVLFGKL